MRDWSERSEIHSIVATAADEKKKRILILNNFRLSSRKRSKKAILNHNIAHTAIHRQTHWAHWDGPTTVVAFVEHNNCKSCFGHIRTNCDDGEKRKQRIRMKCRRERNANHTNTTEKKRTFCTDASHVTLGWFDIDMHQKYVLIFSTFFPLLNSS